MRTGLIVAVVALASCGRHLLAPTPNLTGQWQGRFESSVGADTIWLNLAQTDDAITGTWGLTPFSTDGTVNDGRILRDTFTGILALNWTGCIATATVSGSATANALHWTSAGFKGTGCVGTLPESITINAHR